MAIKSTTTPGPVEADQPPFPRIMESVDDARCDGLVVLFTDERKGIVLHPGMSRYGLGDSTSSWVSCLDASNWRPFTGTVTLSNA
jgi:hypothetical protein